MTPQKKQIIFSMLKKKQQNHSFKNSSFFFYNRTIDKGEVKKLVSWVFETYGCSLTLDLLEELKNLGFSYATLAGLSLSIDDLSIPSKKQLLIALAEHEVQQAQTNLKVGQITSVEYFQKLIDVWNQTNENLKTSLIKNFITVNPLNPVYMMAFSGARGNISQVRQLVGMRGLIANPQGQIVDLPIKSNFREGLTVTEYIISCYGARKGLVDTALRTADSGYLTRRLVDIAQSILLRERDCKTKKGISIKNLKTSQKVLLNLPARIIGRIINQSIYSGTKLIAVRNQEISPKLSQFLKHINFEQTFIRSPLTCESSYFICQLCYGWSLAKGKLVDLGEAVGIIAAQSIGEPGTQLTMRTFHTGGVFTAKKTHKILAPQTGWLQFNEDTIGHDFRTRHGESAFFVTKQTKLKILNWDNFVNVDIPEKSLILTSNNNFVVKNQIIGEIYESSLINIEKATKQVFGESSGEIFQENLSHSFNKNLLWILSGDVVDISKTFACCYKKGDLIFKSGVLAQKSISSSFGGYATKVSKFGPLIWKISLFKISFDKIIFEQKNFLKIEHNRSVEFYKREFSLNCFIYKNQFLAHLDLPEFQIQGPGLLKNFNLKFISNKNLKAFKILKGNRFYWLPEYRYLVNSDNSKLLVQDGQYIKKNSLITSKLVAPVDGIIEYVKKRNKVQTIILKPGSEIVSFSGLNKYKNLKIHQIAFIQSKSNLKNNIQLIEKTTDNIFISRYIKSYTINNLEKKLFSENNHIQLQKVFFLTIQPNTKVNLQNQKNLIFIKLKINLKQNISKRIFIHAVPTCLKRDSTCWNLSIEGFQTFQMSSLEAFQERQKFLFNFDFISKRVEKINNINFFLSILNKKELYLKNDSEVKIFQYWFDNQFSFNPLSKSVIIKIFNNFYEKALPVYLTKMPKVSKLKDLSFASIPVLYFDTSCNRIINFIDNNQYLKPNSSIGKVQHILTQDSEFSHSNSQSRSLNRVLILNKEHFFQIKIKQIKGLQSLLFDLNSYLGNFIFQSQIANFKNWNDCKSSLLNFYFKHSGQIIRISFSQIRVRKAIPFYTSSQTKIHKTTGDLVQKNDCLLTLIYDREKTGDIVQGLPQIEQLLEARKTKGLTSILNNVHTQLNTFFKIYSSFYSLNKAVQKSFESLQKIIVNQVQHVYYSQGVTISDKHVEIIVRQMTSKVLIKKVQQSGFLPGELIDFQKISRFNKKFGKTILYRPVILGVTRASLNTESFISAASFQQTTRVLTQAAIKGKIDWLQGLKENVILGRLIPAGTGYSDLDLDL